LKQAPVGEGGAGPPPGHHAHDGGSQDLAGAGRRHQPRRRHHRGPEDVVFLEAHITRGEADADGERNPGSLGLPVHGLLHRHGTGHGISGGAEDGQHAIPQRLDLLPAGALDGVT
jgi:hypothetical protein